MNKIVKDALILTSITLVSGLLLGMVYKITEEPIKKSKYNVQQEAYKTVFEEADKFNEYPDFDSDAAESVLANSEYPDNTIEGVVAAQDVSGNTLGYVITLTSHSGYAGDITFSMGVRNDGTLNGYSITSISETAGLGMKATTKDFYEQFQGKTAGSYEVTKTLEASENQIEAISGATVTSRAITNGVNAGLIYFRSISEGGSANE